MSGDWIKFEANTPEKPEVFAITASMGWNDPDLTVGKLLKIWRWFDQQTLDGNAPSVTLALLDCISGVTGFAKAMCDVGWLKTGDSGLMLPNFSRHNGKTAKQRCLTAKRVANHKSNAEGNADSVTGALPREEKRRIKNNEPSASKFDPYAELISAGVSEQTATDWLAMRKTKRAAVTETVLKMHIAEANKASLPLDRCLRISCSRGWAGFEAAWLKPEDRELNQQKIPRREIVL